MDTTPVSNVFIDKFMPNANPMFALVYVLGCRFAAEGREIKNGDVASALNITEKAVENAWEYWNEQGLVRFLPSGLEIAGTVEKSRPAAMARVPEYSVEEISRWKDNSEGVRCLFHFAERLFASFLTHRQMESLLSFHEYYRLPFEVIEIMLDYCVGNNHRGMHYIEAVARDWADNQIDTVEEAREYISLFSKDYRAVMAAFGLSGKNPNKKQIVFMKRWCKEYSLAMELIEDACEQAVLNTGKASFAYAETILKSWHEKGVKTLEEARSLAEAFKPAEDKPVKEGAAMKKKPSFAEFSQRENKYDMIDRIAREKLAEE